MYISVVVDNNYARVVNALHDLSEKLQRRGRLALVLRM